MDVKGIKCNNPNCDYINMDVKFKDYGKWLNKPCPKCGSILLTEEDYNTLLLIRRFTNLTNNIFSAKGVSHLKDNSLKQK